MNERYRWIIEHLEDFKQAKDARQSGALLRRYSVKGVKTHD